MSSTPSADTCESRSNQLQGATIHVRQKNPREWDEKTKSSWKWGISMFTVRCQPTQQQPAQMSQALTSQTQVGTHIVIPVYS